MAAHCVEEGVQLVFSPRVGLALSCGFGDVARHADSCGRAAAEHAGLDGVREGRTQHHPHDDDAPASELAAGGQSL